MTAEKMATDLVKQKVLEIGSRLKDSPSDQLIQVAFSGELKQQSCLFEAMGLVDIAHTLAAMESGTIPLEPGRSLLTHLLALQAQCETIDLSPDFGDLYTNREAWLARRTDAVGWLGAGRARREATTTAFILVLRRGSVELIDTLILLASKIVDLAQRHLLSIMPDYTYLQAAQPTTFGHYLLGFAFPILRDLERVEAFFARVNLSPMGCGSTNGSRLWQNRPLLADLLGFDGVVPHARDAMWQADMVLEAVSILTACSINLSRLAEDLQVFATQEFALVALDDCHARASKIMPQKKNPFALTHIRGVANKLIGVQTSVFASQRTPTGQPDNRLLVYGELPETLQTVKNTVSLLTEVLENLTFNVERGLALVTSGWIGSTDLAEALVSECGLNFRQAHQLVAFLASQYQNQPMLELDAKILVQTAETLFGRPITLSEQQLASMLDFNLAIQARLEPGGTADESMQTMIAECREKLTTYRDNNLSRKEQVSTKEHSVLALAGKEAQ